MTVPMSARTNEVDAPMRTAASQHPFNDRMERPSQGASETPNFWVDEAIWGHRLYDEQTPWLSVLECLGVALAEGRREEGKPFHEPRSHRLAYTPLIQLRLRNILFNNPRLVLIAERGGADDACWTEWEAWMHANQGGLAEPDFSYLRRHFRSFRDFAATVQFLRASTVEGANNKRWSSQFLFPFGPSALYEDLNVAGSSVSSDRRFFGRTGELLYLMLCRSGRGDEIREAIGSRFLDPSLTYGRLVSTLQGADELGRNPRTGAYLPYLSLPEFAQLAEDWLRILDRSLPGYDALPHLVTMSGLHLLLYLLRRAQQESGEAAPLTLVLEIVSPKRTVVRDLSADSFAHNNLLPQRAVERWISRLADTDDWNQAVNAPDPVPSASMLLREVFDWSSEDDAAGSLSTPSALLDTLRRQAVERHKQHLAKTHGNWGRAIGLSSRRASRRTRYAPTDAFLKTLVVCCVEGRMEFREFVALIYDRYGLLIGDQQAISLTSRGDADLEAFAENQGRLEERLSSLGLVRRLSDQCAYVENPFARKQTEHRPQ
jgi:hypothetical protein